MRARGLAHTGRREYNRWLAERPARTPFDHVVRILLGVRSAAEIRALLYNRYSWIALNDWRAGRRIPPAWVLERLAEVIRADAEQLLAALASVPKRCESPGKHPAAVAALQRINARATAKAAERRGERA
jgi:hypothetical protein